MRGILVRLTLPISRGPRCHGACACATCASAVRQLDRHVRRLAPTYYVAGRNRRHPPMVSPAAAPSTRAASRRFPISGLPVPVTVRQQPGILWQCDRARLPPAHGPPVALEAATARSVARAPTLTSERNRAPRRSGSISRSYRLCRFSQYCGDAPEYRPSRKVLSAAIARVPCPVASDLHTQSSACDRASTQGEGPRALPRGPRNQRGSTSISWRPYRRASAQVSPAVRPSPLSGRRRHLEPSPGLRRGRRSRRR